MKDSLTFFGFIIGGLFAGYILAHPLSYAIMILDDYEVNRTWK